MTSSALHQTQSPQRIATWGGTCYLCPQPIAPGAPVSLLMGYLMVHPGCAATTKAYAA